MVEIKKRCRLCNKIHIVKAEPEDVARWMAGTNIQIAHPYLSVDARELLISSTCKDCWEKMFEEDND